MLKVSLSVLNAVEKGVKPELEVRVHFQQPETYTEEDLLLSVGALSTSMSSEGAYEIANTTITLKNEDRYFSRKFSRELPVKRKVDVLMTIEGEEIEIFSGIVSAGRGGWSIKSGILTLNVNA